MIDRILLTLFVLLIPIFLMSCTSIKSTETGENLRNIYDAIAINDMQATRKFIYKDLSLNDLKNQQGETPLLYAINRGNNHIACLLLDYGANIPSSVQLVRFEKNLIQCFSGATEPRATALISYTDFVLSKDRQGITPLHIAVFESNYPLIIKIIETAQELGKSAIIDSLTNDGMTPLSIAAAHKDYDSLQILIDAGANPALGIEQGQSAFDVSEALGDSLAFDIYQKGDIRFEDSYLRKFRQLLSVVGFSPGHGDSHFDTQTITAVKKFQTSQDIAHHGQPTHLTFQSLQLAATIISLVYPPP